jgi:hypothetical protein
MFADEKHAQQPSSVNIEFKSADGSFMLWF